MGYIKEPEGVDFIIKSKPLTDKERAAISKFIQEIKEKERSRSIKRRTRLIAAAKKTH